MSSHTEENYLKALFHLALQEEQISVSLLSQSMEVSVPTANSMVKKLDAKGWLAYEKYKPLRLTSEGKKAAALIIRKHRLTEMFLVDIMGFSWDNVHEIAEQIEHVKSEAFFDRMDELLGHPGFDPHGSPIPDKNGVSVAQDLRKLSDCLPGDVVLLKAIGNSNTELLRFLSKRSLSLGTEITILHKEEFDNSITVRYPNYEQAVLSQTVSQYLLVSV